MQLLGNGGREAGCWEAAAPLLLKNVFRRNAHTHTPDPIALPGKSLGPCDLNAREVCNPKQIGMQLKNNFQQQTHSASEALITKPEFGMYEVLQIRTNKPCRAVRLEWNLSPEQKQVLHSNAFYFSPLSFNNIFNKMLYLL